MPQVICQCLFWQCIYIYIYNYVCVYTAVYGDKILYDVILYEGIDHNGDQGRLIPPLIQGVLQRTISVI